MPKKTKFKLPPHIHLYKKLNLVSKYNQLKGKPPYLVFICIKPDCNHRIPLDQALGKLCECNRCGNEMILDKITIGLVKPHCQNCIVKKAQPELDKLNELLGDL